MPRIHPVIPLALLTAMQEADRLPETAGQPFGELAAVRFGGSDTVAVQVERYRELLRKGEYVDVSEVAGLVTLVVRRNDAHLVLADAGRVAGCMASDRSGFRKTMRRISPGFLKAWAGGRAVRGVCEEMFGVRVEGEDRAVWMDPHGLDEGELAGEMCRMIGAAVAETLHVFTGFDGALFHETCRARGAERCVWSTESNDRGTV